MQIFATPRELEDKPSAVHDINDETAKYSPVADETKNNNLNDDDEENTQVVLSDPQIAEEEKETHRVIEEVLGKTVFKCGPSRIDRFEASNSQIPDTVSMQMSWAKYDYQFIDTYYKRDTHYWRSPEFYQFMCWHLKRPFLKMTLNCLQLGRFLHTVMKVLNEQYKDLGKTVKQLTLSNDNLTFFPIFGPLIKSHTRFFQYLSLYDLREIGHLYWPTVNGIYNNGNKLTLNQDQEQEFIIDRSFKIHFEFSDIDSRKIDDEIYKQIIQQLYDPGTKRISNVIERPLLENNPCLCLHVMRQYKIKPFQMKNFIAELLKKNPTYSTFVLYGKLGAFNLKQFDYNVFQLAYKEFDKIYIHLDAVNNQKELWLVSDQVYQAISKKKNPKSECAVISADAFDRHGAKNILTAEQDNLGNMLRAVQIKIAGSSRRSDITFSSNQMPEYLFELYFGTPVFMQALRWHLQLPFSSTRLTKIELLVLMRFIDNKLKSENKILKYLELANGLKAIPVPDDEQYLSNILILTNDFSNTCITLFQMLDAKVVTEEISIHLVNRKDNILNFPTVHKYHDGISVKRESFEQWWNKLLGDAPEYKDFVLYGKLAGAVFQLDLPFSEDNPNSQFHVFDKIYSTYQNVKVFLYGSSEEDALWLVHKLVFDKMWHAKHGKPYQFQNVVFVNY